MHSGLKQSDALKKKMGSINSGSKLTLLHKASPVIETQNMENDKMEDINTSSMNDTRNGKTIDMFNEPMDLGARLPVLLPLGSARRASGNRSFTGTRSVMDGGTDIEKGGIDKDMERSVREHGFIKFRNKALLSGSAYCLSSCSMILLNKVVLSSYNFEAGISLMFYQNLVSVVIIYCLSYLGVISTEPLTWRLVRVWLPVNLIFVGMLVTSIYSLKYINIAMVTILKNVTNIITALGELYMFNKHQNGKVWASLIFMIISAVSGGITDLSFHAVGYAWQMINCFLTAAYSLTLRKVMDLAKQQTKSGTLSEFSMALLNNALSLPLGLILILTFNEWEYLCSSPILRIPMFWVVATSSGVLGLSISFTSMWFLHQTGPTTYSLVGSLNKIPISVAGILLFRVPINLPNFLSILFGLVAGVFFARAKMSK